MLKEQLLLYLYSYLSCSFARWKQKTFNFFCVSLLSSPSWTHFSLSLKLFALKPSLRFTNINVLCHIVVNKMRKIFFFQTILLSSFLLCNGGLTHLVGLLLSYLSLEDTYNWPSSCAGVYSRSVPRLCEFCFVALRSSLWRANLHGQRITFTLRNWLQQFSLQHRLWSCGTL